MNSTRGLTILLALFLALPPCQVPAAPEQLADVQKPPALGVAAPESDAVVLTAAQLQRRVLELLVADDLDQARKLLADSLELPPAEGQRLESWLADYQQFREQRRLRRQETADEHVAEAQKHIKDEKFEEALASAYLAVLASPQPRALREQPWMLELVQKCARQADGLSEQGEYGKASLLLREISLIYKDQKDWEDRFEEAGLHASILGAYDKDSGWEERLRDAETTDFESAVQIIDRWFVKPVDYRKMLLGALNGVRSFLTTRRLDQSFPAMAEKQAVASLKDFLDEKIEATNKEKHVSAADLVRVYWQIILRNRQGLRLPDPVIVDLLTNQACQAIDDYTEMIWPDQQRWFSRTTTGSFTGIGVQIRVNQAKQLEVVTPLVGTPAFKAGLQASDLIVAVDGKSTEGITVDQAVRRITGQRGTTVKLTIKRPGRPDEFTVPIVRDVIKIESVLGYNRRPDQSWNYIVDDAEKIAYVRVSNFMKNTAAELDQAIQACRDQKARAIILDLRFNPGGTLKAAEEVSDRFLPKGRVIVSTRGQRASPYVAKVLKPDSCDGWPVVVLTSDKSASAAEIVAGALQDHDRAKIVGERTFGKGLVQRPFRVRVWTTSEVAIKVTTAYWYLPSGRNVQRFDDSPTWGVEPDFEVDLTPEEFQSLRRRWINAEIIENPNGLHPAEAPEAAPPAPPAEAPPAEPAEQGAPSALPDDDTPEEEKPDLPDPQLQTALLMARLELIANQK